MSKQYRWFVGIDWAAESHEVCILDAAGDVVDRRTINHTGAGIAELVRYLEQLSGAEPELVAVGIEIPRGAVVEALIEHRFEVYSLNPKQMDRFRDRHTMAGAKDDRRDAFVIGDSLRSDRVLFHQVQLDDPLVIRVRELSRTEQDVQQQQTRVANQLRDLLWRYFPQAIQLSPGLDEAWLWDLLEAAPTPEKAQRLKRSRIDKILRVHRIRRLTAEQVETAFDVQPFELAPGSMAAASEHVLLLLPVLRLLHGQRKEIAKRMEAVLAEMQTQEQEREHRDVTILRSMPGAGRVVTATMLAEASQAVAERDYRALRSYTGVAPVTKQSGKRSIVGMRRSCNPRLRNAVYHWSMTSIQHDERSRAQYAALRKKGHSHSRALRSVADRLLAVLTAMLKSGRIYDPSLRSTSVVTTSESR
jgi:transposase